MEIKNYTLCQKQKKCFRNCLCKYLVKNKNDKFTHLLYGKYNAKYNIIDNDLLYVFILKNKNAINYSFTDCLTDYFKFYVDIDLKDKDIEKYKIVDLDRNDFLEYIINTLVNVIEETTDCNHEQLKFIYCERTDKQGGLHAYFINITIDIATSKLIIKKLQERIITENKYNYPEGFYKKVIDDSVYKINGLRIIYSSKDDVYYEINQEKSTYKLIPNNIKQQLTLLSLKTNETKNNFNLKEFGIEKYNIKQNELVNIIDNTFNNTINDNEMENVNNYTSNDIKQLVNMLKKERCNDRKLWIDVGLCLKNINREYFDIWNTWSQQYDKYNEKECMSQWKSFKPKQEKGLNIGSLFYWASIDSPEKYKEFKRKDKINNLIMECKDNFKNNKLDIGKVISSNNYYYIELNDRYCPMYGNEHPNKNLYIEVTPFEVVMKCRSSECIGKRYPFNYIPIPNIKSVNTLFNFNFNNMNIINFNTNNTAETIDIDETIKVFDDSIFNTIIVTSLNGTHYDIAKVIHYLTKNMYNIDRYTKKWYEFRNHRWRESQGLRSFISNDLVEYYLKIIKYFEKNKSTESYKSIEKIKNLIKSLKTSAVKNNIMTETEEIFTINDNEKFITKLDTTSYLLGFENGVYDFNIMKFRNGEPQDYISISCGYDYQDKPTRYNTDVNKFLEDIQPNPEQRKYLLMCISAYLIGINEPELFHIFSGDNGRNGKSKLCELLGYTLGDYYSQIASEIFTRPKPDADKPHPELLNLIKKRIVVASEPDQMKGDKLNSAHIKFITGNDECEYRQCHSNTMIKFKAKFGLFLLCNNIPIFDVPDKAIYKRLRCINFPTEFVDEPILPNQKKINEKLSQEFKYWCQDFMLILIENYKDYKSYKLKPTKDILQFTNEYKENADIYLSYLNENTEESDKHISMKTLHANFTVWYKRNYPNRRVPDNREFLSGAKKYKEYDRAVKIGKKTTSGFKCLKLKDDIDED